MSSVAAEVNPKCQELPRIKKKHPRTSLGLPPNFRFKNFSRKPSRNFLGMLKRCSHDFFIKKIVKKTREIFLKEISLGLP